MALSRWHTVGVSTVREQALLSSAIRLQVFYASSNAALETPQSQRVHGMQEVGGSSPRAPPPDNSWIHQLTRLVFPRAFEPQRSEDSSHRIRRSRLVTGLRARGLSFEPSMSLPRVARRM